MMIVPKEEAKRTGRSQKKLFFRGLTTSNSMNSDCYLEINQPKLTIKTSDVHHVPGLQIGAAYPVL